jgi:hemoglobin-like flavoprotein
MDTTYEAVRASYHRCEHSGDFFATFYDNFFAKSPEIPPKFADTDMDKQKQVVMASVLICLRLKSGDVAARRTVEEIGEKHSRSDRDISLGLYGLWLDALCESIQAHDPEYSPELETLWRESMQEAIDLITSMY